MKIPIIYEDKNLLVVNKPSGLLVHSDAKSKEPTLIDWLLETQPNIKEVGEPMEIDGKIIHRPGIVHRLDKETSGVLVIAKNQETFEEIKIQFQERKIKKAYLAIVWGFVKDEKGTISASIGRSANFGKFIASRGKRGKIREAITEYKVLKRFVDKNDNKWTLVEVHPKTGRTHQIRVHFNYINHPVSCDKLYGGKKACLFGLSRLALHAKSLEFEKDGKKLKFEAPLPEDLRQTLKDCDL